MSFVKSQNRALQFAVIISDFLVLRRIQDGEQT